MATAIRNSSFVCLILNLVVCVVQFLPVTYSKNILTVPHSAAPGYLVSRIACSRLGVKIKLFGHNADEFYDKFIITASGKLVVKTSVFSDINKLYYISTFENNRCFDNVQKHNNFIINITNTKDIVHFTKRQYSGIVSHSDVGNALLGLNEIRFSHDKSVPVSEIQFSFEGGGSELFSIESISPNTIQIRANHDITVPYTKVYHFTLTAKVRGHTAGGSDVVVVLDDIAGSNINQGQDNKNVANFEQNALPGESKNIFRKGGDDGRLGSGHRRVRRQTFGSSSQTITLDETATGRLFAIDPALPSGTTFKFNLTSALPENVFSVDNEGNVSLRAGEKLDYDFGPKTYTINLDVLNSNDQVIKTIVVTLNLNNVNDENPYFITKPLPYLAAIPETAEAALKVFQLQAVDPDQGSVVYYIEGVNDLFDVQINTGWIVTTRQITSGTDFKVKVYAEDSSASTSQKTPTVTVEIRRGFRKPQFLSESYVAAVEEVNQADQTMTQTSFETTDKQGNKVKIEAINFQEKLGGTIQYTVYENTQTKSTKFAVENGNLKTLQPLDYESGSHQFQLTIMALDTHSGLTNLAQLEVNVVDKNEYDPLFSKSTYTATVQETLPLNSNVTTVMATDRDSNTRISYSVTNPLFSVKTYDNGQTGVIVVNGQLDYDKTPGNRYEFDVIATDNGQNPFPRNATARVVVYITNVNDQDPKFDDNLVTTLIDNTVGGSTVIVVRATDEDGDGVKYTFEGKTNVRDLFQIDEITGKITLQADRTIPSGTDQYRLPVVATDDGSCCGGVKIRSSTTTVVINIIDAVNIKPSFERCSDYKPEVLEGQEPGAYVTQVNAKDTNRGENGVVEYYIIQDSKNTAQFFSINKTTGQLVTKEKLDRETQTSRNLFITVRAVDKGQPPLDDYCTFPITVGDVNDNDPVFTATQYSGRILKAASVGENVLTVKANDNDLGLNANILYSLSTNPGDYFSIDRDTGVISVAKSLTPTGSSVSLIAMATDGGTPSRSATVAVSITISTDPNVLPPSWDVENPQFSVKESESVNFVVGRVKAQNRITDVSDPGLDFNIVGLNNRLSDRDPSGHFFIKTLPDGQSVDISINKVLDYETTKEFTIIIRASNRAERSGVYSDNIVKINVIDVNDVNPEFQNINPFSGKIDIYVKENSPVGSPVSAIVATDGDLTSPFNLLTYDLTGSSKDLFVIDPKNGNITTRQVFDRETVGYYFVTALAIDGSKSGRPDVTGPNTGSAAVQIIIQDVNDNSPYFEKSLYEATVKEDSFIGTTIVKIEAKDKDEINSTTFTYTLEGSSLFDVNRRTGEIRVAGNLDYEQEPNEYTLTLSVDDTFYSNKTKVKITILDTNDNPPVFTKSTYVITNITENDDYSGKPPILTVTATDPDINRAKGINYELSQGDSTITNLFSIDKQTGALRLLGKLDRDKPNGREVYQFNVLAIDEPGSGTSLTGYATIQIFPIDINDNAPIFDTSSLTGQVPEMSEVGKSVMTIKAFDYDFGENAHVTFEMVPGSQVPRDAFRLETDGSVLTTVNNLDRETNPVFTFQVKAKDNGNPQLFTTATATVNIGDINDNAPTFSQKIYATTIPETHTGRIMVISATDADINDTLNFDLIGDGNTFFSMRPEERKIGSLVRTGVLEVYKKPDYENPTERFFNLTIEVKDSDSKFKDTAYIEITVQDVNDETPIITPGSEFREKDENVPVNTILANFTATDRDVGVDNGNFDFFISGKPRNETPDFFFKIDSNGVVRVRNPLDFEKIRIHVVKILAIDRGLPPKTGTATLTVSLNNINDNDPHFFGDPKPVVMENEPPQTVITLRGADADAAPYGGPFTFALPPCAQNPTCQYFDLRYNSNGDNGKGTAVITSKVKFDREATKFYYMPIIMTDMRGHRDQSSKGRTATNTLTIEIGDVNEHKSSSGTQDIHVFNYKGLFKNIYIGSVHYEDLDDNDRGDKTFRLTGPKGASNYFQVDEVGGKVKMLAHVPTGTHKLNVDVYDTKLKNTITSYVNIKIEDLPEEAPYRSGSVRLTGITAAEFINGDNSPLVKFRNLLKSKLTPNSEVQIVSVMDTEVDNVKYCDVRYAARGSPYYQSSKLDGIVDKDRTEFQRTLPPNAKIAMVNIDMCLREICEGGGCFNKLIVKDSPNLVDAKGSSYVGVETEVQAECGCIAATNVTECSAAYCANGGTCNKDWWGVISCKCPPEFDGPRCQQTRHGFDGTGYALYQTLQQCENSVTSVKIVTRNENGLIMYNGPVRELGTMDPRDYVVLQLRNGYPELTIDHGTGSLTLTVNGKDSEGKIRMPKLNDGKWHQIDIRRQGKLVTLTVDHCLKAESVEGSAQDRSPCEARGATKGENIFLNVHSQLQLGGRYSAPSYPTNVIQTKFKGCMRNLRHNNELYDLYTKGFYAGTTDGCPEEDDACGKNSVNGPKCQNGDCQLTTFPSPPLIPGAAECVCYPGYRGTVCQYNTTVRDFNDNSFMDWELTNAFKNSLSTKELDIQLMYRSRDKDGVLFHVQAEVSTEFMKLEIIDNTVQILYNLGDGNRNLQLSDVTASDGQWHTIQVKRRGLHITLMMDGGEGSNFIETYGSSDLLHQEMTVKGDQIYAGAEVSYEHSPNIDATNPKDYEKSCMNDIRLDNAWFPMTTAENQDTNSVKLLRSVETKSDCIRNDCTPAVKAACDAVGKICRPLWGTYECVCPVHTYDVQGSCQPIDYCSQSPCHHLSTCINDINNVNGFKCQCPVGMTGTICNIAERKPVEPEDGSGWLVPVIVVSIIVVLVIAAVICYIMCRRRIGNDGDDSKFLDLEKEDYDIRENIVDYDEEGAGEDDHEGYDINRLRKPADIMSRMDNPELMATKERPLKSGPPGGHIGDFIDDRLGDADEDPDAPPYDTTREFDYEGGGSDAGSLSSLNTTTSDGDQDYDYLNEWGPKFAKLADMYNNYADSD